MGLVTVEEEKIAEAILRLLEQEKTVAEGAGAAPLAAALRGQLPIEAPVRCARTEPKVCALEKGEPRDES